MIKIKNIQPGIVVIPDAGLKLASGQNAELELTPHLKNAISTGLVKEISQDQVDDNKPDEKVTDLSKLSAPDAIARLGEENDPDTLKGLMETEKRRTVLDALNDRMTELADGSKA